MDYNLGPLQVTEDMQEIGLQSTFMAGYFYDGAPLLQRIVTPANSRTDYTTEPDVYNQTTALDMGMLLEDIYQCAELGGGALIAAYDSAITQGECRAMIETMNRDRIGVLLQAGLPDGTKFAHKHGWTSPPPDYVIKQVADVGIVYSPGGNYVLAVFQYHPVQILFDPDNLMLADISRAIYNYFNIPGE
jgi:beta-lactamase class A